MGTSKKAFGCAWLLMLGLTFAGMACATTITMDFDDFAIVPHQEAVDTYYDGGCSVRIFGLRPGTCGGPDYGVVWSGAIAGYSPRINYMPSSPNSMRLSRRHRAVMNVADGFGSHFSLDYFAITQGRRHRTGSIFVYSGLGGTGNLLASDVLTPSSCSGRYVFSSCWDFLDIAFSGIAHSVIFSQYRRAFIGFDDVSFNTGPPNVAVPEPSVLGMFGLGVLLIALITMQRGRQEPLHGVHPDET